MNALDIVILAVIALCAIVGYRKGLIRTIYRLVAIFVAIFVARQLYPYVARALRQTMLLPQIRDAIANILNLESLFSNHASARGAEVIDALPIPAFLQYMLHTNNTPSMFEVLQVATVEEYISGFFANIVINGISILLVFALTMIALAVIGYILDIVSKLPVIRTLNNFGGLVFGVIISGVIIWLGLVIAAVLFATGANPTVFALLEGSWIAQRLFEATLPQLASVA